MKATEYLVNLDSLPFKGLDINRKSFFLKRSRIELFTQYLFNIPSFNIITQNAKFQKSGRQYKKVEKKEKIIITIYYNFEHRATSGIK